MILDRRTKAVSFFTAEAQRRKDFKFDFHTFVQNE